MYLDRTDPTAWPFPAVTEARERHEDSWRQISDDRADEFLNVLPPIYVPGGFMVSEAADSGPDGYIYACVAAVDGTHWMREIPRKGAGAEIQRLRDALRAERVQAEEVAP